MKKISSHWFIILLLIFFSLLRGGNDPSDSIIGIKRCDDLGWYLFLALQIFCVAFLFYGIKIIKNEQELKESYGY
jgi:hypothetical protein